MIVPRISSHMTKLWNRVLKCSQSTNNKMYMQAPRTNNWWNITINTHAKTLYFYCVGMRHPEELSLMRKVDKDDIKRVVKEAVKKKKKGDTDPVNLSVNGTHHHNSSGSLDGKLSPFPNRSPIGPSPSVSLVFCFKTFIYIYIYYSYFFLSL